MAAPINATKTHQFETLYILDARQCRIFRKVVQREVDNSFISDRLATIAHEVGMTLPSTHLPVDHGAALPGVMLRSRD